MIETAGELPGYDELTRQLAEHGIAASAAEVHGLLTGLTCTPEGGSVDWLELVRSLGDGQAAEPDKELAAGLLALSRSVGGSWHEQGLTLLLPGTDSGLTQRTAAVAEWVRGFLLGVGAGQPVDGAISDVAREILEDMVELSRLEPEDEPQDDPEGQERALMELEEYLRVAAQLLREELAAVPSGD